MDSDHDHDNFSSVSWSENADQPTESVPSTPGDSRHATMSGEAATSTAADAGTIRHDDRTVGGEKLECTVGSPIKENDGTKDAFISYLITTNVSYIAAPFYETPGINNVVYIFFVSTRNHNDSSPIHRFRLSLQAATARLSCCSCASSARQAAHGICSR